MCPKLSAQEDDNWTFNFFLENDLFANTDLNYTNGIRLSTVSPDLDGFTDPRGQKYPWVEKLNAWLDFVQPRLADGDSDGLHHNIVISLGQLMFTPTDKSRVTVDPDDRPYAGWLYLGLGYHARTADTLHTTEFNIGMVGPASLARQSQDFIHDLHGIDKFQGWDNQLDNEPAFQLIFERKHRTGRWQTRLFDGLQVETITHWGASVGTIASYVNAGVELRAGWDIPMDFGTSTLRPGGDNNTPGTLLGPNRPFQVHGFLATDARLVLNNIFLDGNTFHDSHGVDRRLGVADIAAGVAATWRRVRLSYAHVYRTRAFTTQREPQFYGAVSLSYHHNF